ncbi:hypothetical protein D3C87_1257810 [compost metagenome]
MFLQYFLQRKSCDSKYERVAQLLPLLNLEIQNEPSQATIRVQSNPHDFVHRLFATMADKSELRYRLGSQPSSDLVPPPCFD